MLGPLAAALGFALVTLDLNRDLLSVPRDAAVLVLWFMAAGMALAISTAVPWLLVRRLLADPMRELIDRTLAPVPLLLPMLAVLALPDVGLLGGRMTDWVAQGPLHLTLRALLVAALVPMVFGLASALAKTYGISPRRLATGFLLVALGILVVPVLWHALRDAVGRDWHTTAAARPLPESGTGLSASLATFSEETLRGLPASSAGGSERSLLNEESLTANSPGVVLLCIDGADPRVIERMVADGDLPTFSRLIETGTFGPLDTYSPTLSPAIWTTLITGQAPHRHGIHGFTRYRVPGIETFIDRFPVSAGLNFRLPRLLEKIDRASSPRVAYTRLDRRTPTVWQILRYATQGLDPTGVYRWRVTWPAEQTDFESGFMMAANVTLGEVKASINELDPELVFSAPEVRDIVRSVPVRPVDSKELWDFFDPPEAAATADETTLRVLRRSLNYTSVRHIEKLMAGRQPRLLVAGFYSVDAFNHLFWQDLKSGSALAGALEQRYRFTDERLGELLELLGPATNLIVTSDHGFDFEHGHHGTSPPGILFAYGPAFEPGRRISGASVFDIAPLTLELLGVPPAKDMPGTDSYSAILSEQRRGSTLEPIESWQGLMPLLEDTVGGVRNDGTDPALLDELKTLGYIE